MDIEEVPTIELVQQLYGQETEYTVLQIRNELLARIDTTPESPTLNFIRPTRINL